MGRHSQRYTRSEACAPSNKKRGCHICGVTKLCSIPSSHEKKRFWQIPGSRRKLYVEGDHPVGSSKRARKAIFISGIFLTISNLPIRDKSAHCKTRIISRSGGFS